MTLQEIAGIAEILGALGVIASLVFVGWQIRENTIATKAHIHEQVTQTYLAFLNSAIANPEAYATGIQATEADFSKLSAGEKTFFFGTALGFFKHFELMFVQNRKGIMDREIWDAWCVYILMYFHQPGIQVWWKSRRDAFIPEFREFLESSAPPQMTSFADVLDQ